MKKYIGFILVGIFASSFTLLGLHFYKLNQENPTQSYNTTATTDIIQPTNYHTSSFSSTAKAAIDFSEAVDKSIDAVVHVKNVTIARQPRSLLEYYYGGGPTRKAIQGLGSGVIISPDGYIITNFHVIKGASEIEITLNNNQTYQAELVGSAPENDIALLKIDQEDLPYLAFADSNQAKVGEWVLAIGNPFNLTSTVTAGIISAKSRDLNASDRMFQSFIQTDAAVNPGNSGGALVNTNGDLIGINTAITSQTGSFIGYSFAIPSNNAKKIVEDLIEFGNVRKAVLGVRGTDINAENKEKLNTTTSQGFYIADVDKNAGADVAGLKKGDIITEIDGIKIRKYADLVGYINTKNPGEMVEVVYLRNGNKKTTEIELSIFEVYKIEEVGIEVTNASKEDLKRFKVDKGVKINRVLSNRLVAENLNGILITEINEKSVSDIKEVEKIIASKPEREPLRITFKSPNANEKTYVFR
ncbi:MAG: trypsin-like peptidase domain-containing protein [Bacteroidota bacterium]